MFSQRPWSTMCSLWVFRVLILHPHPFCKDIYLLASEWKSVRLPYVPQKGEIHINLWKIISYSIRRRRRRTSERQASSNRMLEWMKNELMSFWSLMNETREQNNNKFLRILSRMLKKIGVVFGVLMLCFFVKFDSIIRLTFAPLRNWFMSEYF